MGPEERTEEMEPSGLAGDLRKMVTVDEKAVGGKLSEFVRATVEETLNELLNAEADALCGAQRYERTPERKNGRAGHYERGLETRAGPVQVRMPKLRGLKFETQIIERYRRRECSVEEALVEMYLAGVSVRRVEDITEALWGTRVSASTISELNQKVYQKIEEWRVRPLTTEYRYVYLDGIWLKRSWNGEVTTVAVLVAIGVNQAGYREVIGVMEGAKEDGESWRQFLRYLKGRGLRGVRMFISDKCAGLVETLPEFYPEAKWQWCMFHFYRNVLNAVPRSRRKEAATLLRTIHAQESREAGQEKAETVARKLEEKGLADAARLVRQGVADTLTYYTMPAAHWRCIRTNNVLERLNREIRRRTRVVGAFPDGHAALMLVAARLRYVAGSRWGAKRYLDLECLEEPASASG
jgi:transposase-like protein